MGAVACSLLTSSGSSVQERLPAIMCLATMGEHSSVWCRIASLSGRVSQVPLRLAKQLVSCCHPFTLRCSCLCHCDQSALPACWCRAGMAAATCQKHDHT